MNQAKLYLDTLNYEEQNKLIINLTNYAAKKAKGKSWRTGNAEELPEAENTFSVVTLAFERVLEGKRKWNPDTEPDFNKYMLDVIDSLLSHLATGKDNEIFVNENDSQFATNNERKNVGVLAAAEEKFVASKATKNFEEAEWLVRHQLSPEEELIAAEEKKFNDNVLQAICEAAADDYDVSAMIEAMGNNYVKSGEIAEYTGIDVDRIYNARKRLNTIVIKVKQKFDI
jgi:hypothetical protein